jgi:hypothetical protein
VHRVDHLAEATELHGALGIPADPGSHVLHCVWGGRVLNGLSRRVAFAFAAGRRLRHRDTGP